MKIRGQGLKTSLSCLLSLLLVLSSFGCAFGQTYTVPVRAELVPEGYLDFAISAGTITATNSRANPTVLTYSGITLQNNEASDPIRVSSIAYTAPTAEGSFALAADSTNFATATGKQFSLVICDGSKNWDFGENSSEPFKPGTTVQAQGTKSFTLAGHVSKVEQDTSNIDLGSLVVTVESGVVLPYLAIESMTAGNSFKVNIAGVNTNNMQYSYDNSTWNDLETKEYSVTGGRMYLRGSKTNSTATVSTYYGSNTDESCIKITDGSVRLSGNIMGLYNYSWVESNQSQDSVGSRWFANLFTNSTAIVDASELLLPARELGESSYAMMFYGCTNLKNAPALPMTSVKATSCNSMFYNCSSLEDIPLLYITAFNENYGLKNMFVGTGARLSATRSEVYKYEYRIPASGTAIESGSNNLHQMFSQENDEYFTPSLNTQYYVNLPTVAAS